jgi:hypothetical protein
MADNTFAIVLACVGFAATELAPQWYFRDRLCAGIVCCIEVLELEGGEGHMVSILAVDTLFRLFS